MTAATKSIARHYDALDGPERFVDIPQGIGSAVMGRRLADAGVVRDATAFRVAVWMSGAGRRLQAGEYWFDSPMTVKCSAHRPAPMPWNGEFLTWNAQLEEPMGPPS